MTQESRPDYAAILTASQAVVLEQWPDIELAALNNALTFSPTARVPEVNIAYRRATDAALLDRGGLPHDRETLLDALAHIIHRRMEAGTWGKESAS